MTSSESAAQTAKTFFDALWQKGDFWGLESSGFELERYKALLEMVGNRHYAQVLDLGCGSGVLTKELCGFADRVVGIDVSTAAIERALAHSSTLNNVEFRVANIFE